MCSKSGNNNQKFKYVRFLHLSDLHYPEIDFKEILIDKESGYKSPHVSVLNEVYNILDNTDFILISGDFTTWGEIKGFDECLYLISEKFSHHDIKKIYSVFGNHDLIRNTRDKKFDQYTEKAQKYPFIDFVGHKMCEQRKLTTPGSIEMDLDLLLINSCKNSSDNPIVPERLKECVVKALLCGKITEKVWDIIKEKVEDQERLKECVVKAFLGEKIAEKVWDIIKEKVEDQERLKESFKNIISKILNNEKFTEEAWINIKEQVVNSTLIDDISFQEEDYNILINELENLGSLICLSHYNLVSFNGIDTLNSFFSDQGKLRDIFVNHRNTVIFLSGHTHTQECTVIENPEDCTNKLICITSPPFFKIKSSAINGFNVVDLILCKDVNNIYKPVGCKIQKINFNTNSGTAVDCKRIRFSRNITNLEFTVDEIEIINTLKKLSSEADGNVRINELLDSLNQSREQEAKKFKDNDLHEILMYFWWIGVVRDYSAMNRENELEVSLMDYVGGTLCLPLSL